MQEEHIRIQEELVYVYV